MLGRVKKEAMMAKRTGQILKNVTNTRIVSHFSTESNFDVTKSSTE